MKKEGFLYRMFNAVWVDGVSYLSCFSPTLVSKIRYRQNFGKKLNLKNPRGFNEKLMWLKLNTYNKNPLVVQCADKVRVRDYIKKRGCEEILVDCLGVYEKPEDIPWHTLPQKFVLKCNHGAGYNIICTDKDKLDSVAETKRLSGWLKEKYWRTHAEIQYRYITPRIICETYLQPESGRVPDDYKVFCFDGKAEYIMLCRGRGSEREKFYFVDKNWNFLPWEINSVGDDTSGIKRPSCLKELFAYAEKLSAGFPFVRIDFYVLGDRIYFGEMTFTPCGCLDPYYTEEGYKVLSRRLKLGVSDV